MKNKTPAPNPTDQAQNLKEKLKHGEQLIEAFTNLGISINRQSPNDPPKSLMITSTLPREGHGFISRQLATQFSHKNKDVLLIQIQASNQKEMISAKLGLDYFLEQLLNEEIRSGSLQTYGFYDLVCMLHLQSKNGQLTLTAKNDVSYFMEFKNGILCAIKIPKHELKFIQNQSTPLKDQVEQFACKLANAFKQIAKKKLKDFAFKESPNTEFKEIAGLINKFVLDDEPLEDQNFIAKTIRKNVIQINQNCSLMLCGIKSLDWTHPTTAKHIKTVLSLLKKQFDLVILQAPSVMSNKETKIMGSLMEGTILVIRQNYARKRKIKRAVRRLMDNDVNVIGTVLNMNHQYL